MLGDIDSFWEYGDPEASEKRFRVILGEVEGDERLEVLTQIARTYSLRRKFAEAHRLLDEVEGMWKSAGTRCYIRYLLERGRTFNSSGQPEKARPLFVEAWEQAQVARWQGLAVDAAHMVAISYAGTPQAIFWNQKALTLARHAVEAKAQALLPAILNNCAWDLHDMGRFMEALPLFMEAEAVWTERQKPAQIQIAQWSVARCLRSLGRYGEALARQQQLEREHQHAGTKDGYVFEEIAENMAALGKLNEAMPYFQKAAEQLSLDVWFVEHEAQRLAYLWKNAGIP